jgi:hypothetical protein
MDIEDILNKSEFRNSKEGAYKKLHIYLDAQLMDNTSEETYNKLLEVFVTRNKAKDWYKARNWFYSKSLALGNKRPYDLCLDGKDEIVYKELINIEHGNLA